MLEFSYYYFSHVFFWHEINYIDLLTYWFPLEELGVELGAMTGPGAIGDTG